MVLLQNVMELMLSTYSFPLLLVVMLERIMSLSPEHLLSRLRSKAAVMGDPNPWLVQVNRSTWSSTAPSLPSNAFCTMTQLACMHKYTIDFLACGAVHHDQAGQ